jgi:ATP-dependent 26S proteasome regulatory subunit
LTIAEIEFIPSRRHLSLPDSIAASYSPVLKQVTMAEARRQALDAYRAELIKSREWEAKLKALRLEIKDLVKEYDKTEDNIKALQSVGQIIGEVLKQLDDERCSFGPPLSPETVPR